MIEILDFFIKSDLKAVFFHDKIQGWLRKLMNHYCFGKKGQKDQ